MYAARDGCAVETIALMINAKRPTKPNPTLEFPDLLTAVEANM
jgi:hypothetical protein